MDVDNSIHIEKMLILKGKYRKIFYFHTFSTEFPDIIHILWINKFRKIQELLDVGQFFLYNLS